MIPPGNVETLNPGDEVRVYYNSAGARWCEIEDITFRIQRAGFYGFNKGYHATAIYTDGKVEEYHFLDLSFHRWEKIKGNKPISNAMNASSGGAVNDHVCPACKNDRCSKSEPSCWRCGNSFR